MVDFIRQHFSKYGPLGPPCSPNEIEMAEHQLALKLPDELKALYLSFNGFRGPTSAAYLFPLLGNSGNSLVEMTQFFWSQWSRPDFSNCLFYGSSSCDNFFVFNLSNPGEIICYHHHMEDEYESAGNSILEAYLRDEQWFNDLP